MGENLSGPWGPKGGWLMVHALPGGQLWIFQGFTLGPPLSNIFFSDLEEKSEFTFIELSDDT